MILKSLLIAACMFQQTDAPVTTEKELTEALQKLGVAFESGDKGVIKASTTTENLSITPHVRCNNQAELLAMIPGELRIASYKIDNLRVMPIKDDVAALTFDATIDGTYKGTKLSSPVQVIETWVRKDGKWLQATYQETAVK